MNEVGLSFHHLGLAVRDPSHSINFLRALGYSVGEVVFDARQNVNAIMCMHFHEPAVEILYPGKDPGPIDVLVNRHASGIIYHSCYETSTLKNSLAALEQLGLRVDCIVEPSPAPLFSGRNVSFYRIKGIGLIEILE